jgi:valyl-tRNA synthetase
MIMAGFEFMGDIPFRRGLHPRHGARQPGPQDVQEPGQFHRPAGHHREYSADALRFSLIMLTATGQDVYVSKEKFELGRNFGTKIWNVARFLQMQPAGAALDVRALRLDPARWSPDDWHIVAKVDDAAKAAQDCLERFRFNDYAHVLYEFFWHEFCDWYVEYAKGPLNGDDPARRDEVLKVMHFVFNKALRLLHPLMPFLTEELWHGMGYGLAEETIMTASWPTPDAMLRGLADEHVAYVDQKHELIRLGRNLRADYEIAPGQKVDFAIKPSDEASAAALRRDAAMIGSLLKAANLVIDPAFQPTGAMPSALGALGGLYLSLGTVDVAAEVTKLQGQLTAASEELARIQARLGNAGFVQKAKVEVINQTTAKRDELIGKCDKLKRLIEAMTGGAG